MRWNVALVIRRVKILALSGAFRVASSFANLIVSFFVVRTQSPDLWGQIIPLLLLIDFGFSFVSWGSAPYLMRTFSDRPSNMYRLASASFTSRLPLLGIFIVTILFLSIGYELKLWLVVLAMARYVYQSTDAIAQFQKNFSFMLLVEVIYLILVIVPTLVTENLSVTSLLCWLVLGMSMKAIALLIFYRGWLTFSTSLSWKFYQDAFPFLLLSFTGMIQQRSDLYCVAWMLAPAETARYQVFINLLIFAQFAGSLLLSPFTKNIFRLGNSSLQKLERNFVLAGIFFSIISGAAVYAIVTFLYDFTLPLYFYVGGVVYIYLFYLYLPQHYRLNKENKQLKASLFSFVATAISLGVSLWLIPFYGLTGALMATLSSQFILVLIYQRRKIIPQWRG